MATFQKKPNGNTTAIIRRKGYPTVSKTFAKKASARAWASETEELMRQGQYDLAEDKPLSALLDKFEQNIVPLKRHPAYQKTNLARLRKWLSDLSVRELTAQAILDMVSGMKDEDGLTSESIRKTLNTLNQVVKTAELVWDVPFQNDPVARAKYILKSTKALDKYKPRARRLRDGEEEKLMDALSGATQPKAIAMLTLETARRLNELMRVDDTVLYWRKEKPFLKVADSKTGDAFEVPLSARASAILKGVDKKENGRYFDIRNDTVSQSFARAVKRAGLHDLKLTDLRHEALSRLFERGFSVPEVMAISGHKTPDILLKVYAQVQTSTLSAKL